MTTKRIAHKDKTRVLVLVGTRKGAFIFESNRNRKKWSVSGPHFAGWSVHHLIHDARVGGAGMLLAALNHDVYGSNIQHSTDLGQTWQMADGPAFAKDSVQSVKKVWHVQPGHASRPSEVWAGVDPASLFKSEDGGHAWSPVPGLNDHPTRAEYWQPGAGGLILHGIVPHATDANCIWVAISAAGVFRTDDGGATWQPRNRGTQACFLPEGKQWPDVGQCCHHLLVSPTRPELLFQQNHCGMYRSDNGGDEWTNIGEGLPSHFGFGLGILPREPETVYVAPEVSDECRYMPRVPWPSIAPARAGAIGNDSPAACPPTALFSTCCAKAWPPTRATPAACTWAPAPGRCFTAATRATTGTCWRTTCRLCIR